MQNLRQNSNKSQVKSNQIRKEIFKTKQNLSLLNETDPLAILQKANEYIEQSKSFNLEPITQISYSDITPDNARLAISGCNFQQVINQYLLEIIDQKELKSHEFSLLAWTIEHLLVNNALVASDRGKVSLWLSLLASEKLPELRKIQIAKTLHDLLNKKK